MPTNDITDEQRIILDYIVSHLDEDQRPYLKVKISGLDFFRFIGFWRNTDYDGT